MGDPPAGDRTGRSTVLPDTTPVEWTSPPTHPVASPLGVDVWRFSLRAAASETSAYARLLSDDERARAARVKAPRHRDRFVTGRGVLRTILGTYTGMDPNSVRFRYDRAGKPHLDREGPEGVPVSFNLSHSEDLALLAVSAERELGIDLERVRTDLAADRIAARVLPAADAAAIDALRGRERDESFFALWTRLEALAKGSGEGLGRAIARLHAPLEGTGSGGGWAVRHLVPEPGYVAALAVATGAHGEFSLRFWRFET